MESESDKEEAPKKKLMLTDVLLAGTALDQTYPPGPVGELASVLAMPEPELGWILHAVATHPLPPPFPRRNS